MQSILPYLKPFRLDT